MAWDKDENSELEEGEACSYDKEDGDDNVDPDVSLSYIDEKIKNVLGHLRKDFEGDPSAETLGAKYGGYGSFLPARERSPSIFSRPKTPERCSSPSKSPRNFPIEGVEKNFVIPSIPTLSARANALHDSRQLVRNLSVKQDSGLAAAPVVHKSTLKDEKLNRPSNPSGHRPLKVRIKVGPDKNKNVRANAAIYSGLGLDSSPSSSMGNSLDESGGILPVSETLAHESPASILQVMTSSVIPGGILLSPLQESLLCLMRKDRLSANSRPVKCYQEPFSSSAQEPVAVNHEKLLEEVKPAESGRKLPEQMQGDVTNLESDAGLFSKKTLGTDNSEGKYASSGILKSKKPLDGELVTEFVRVNDGAFEVSRGASEDGGGERSSSSNMWKEDSSESKSGQASAKTERRRSSSVEKFLSNRGLVSEKNDFLRPRGSGRQKNAKISAQSKVDSDAFIWKDDTDIDTASASEGNVGQQASFDGHVETTISSAKDKLVLRCKKKLKGSGNSKRELDVSTVDIARVDWSIASKDPNSDSIDLSNVSAKRQKLNSRKDVNKVGENNRSAAKRPVDHRSRDPSLNDDLESGQVVASKKSNNKFHNKGIDNLQMQAAPCAPQNALASEVVPPATGHVVIEDNWVMCDSCEKWRLLPDGINSDQLPEKWLCSMLDWLPGMTSCDISEEETTAAVRARHKIPQNLVPICLQHANGTAPFATSAHVQHHGHPSSNTTSSRKNKKYTSDETAKAGTGRGFLHSSNVAKNHSRESVRSKNEVNQLLIEQNLANQSGPLCKSKLHILDAEKHIPRHKEDDITGGSFSRGEGKQMKVTNRDVDSDARRTSGKVKIGDTDHAATLENSDLDLARIGQSLKVDSFTKSGARNMRNSLDDGKCDARERLLVSVKMGEEAVVASDGGSLDLRMADERGKKRKSREWKENQNGLGSAETGPKKDRKSRGLQNVNEDKRSLKHCRSMPQQTAEGIDSLKKDFVAQHASVTATSSSSKVSGSHKARSVFDEVKGSPVESVSSSPLRPTDPEKFASAGIGIMEKEGHKSGGTPTNGEPRSCWDELGTSDVNHSIKARKEKTVFYSELHRSCDSEYWGVEADKTAGRRFKPFPDAPNGDVETPEYHNGDRRVIRTDQANSISEIGMHNDKVYRPVGETADLHVKKKTSPVSKSQPRALMSSAKRLHDRKQNIPDKASPKSSKGGKDQSTGVSAACGLNEKLDNQVKREACNDFLQKVRVPCNDKDDASVQHDLNQVSWGMVKVDAAQKYRHSGTFRLLPDSEVGKPESETALAGSQQGHLLDGGKYDQSRARQGENAISKSAPHQSWGHRAPGVTEARDLSVPSPVRVNSSSQRAADVLKEAQTLRDRADHFKDSGFGFESNEVYFEAALKFLHGGSLLETSSSEIGRQGDMTQMQVYSTAAKLCECCAVEFERRHDMAAAALAYKCMEVAYWRVVYCKNSSSSRDRTELQASLQLVAQGDSPSSSASDVDNLNNQGTVDKANVTKGAVSHGAGNPVIAARNCSHFLRLLDFTQDVNFAVEASRKSQTSLLAADTNAEKVQNRECLSSVKRVIDFSFQDVGALINLVQLAKRDISRSGLGSVRD